MSDWRRHLPYSDYRIFQEPEDQTEQLCHRCRRAPMVTTVSEGAREVVLCLECLHTLSEAALLVNQVYDVPQEKAWRGALERVGKE